MNTALDGVTLVYSGGMACNNGTSRQSQIDILCDLTAGSGIVDSIIETAQCYYNIK